MLIRADDGSLYVLKLAANPFGTRLLANEYLGTRLAQRLGLATPEPAIVAAPPRLGLPPGPHFGARVPKSGGHARIHDWLPAAAWALVENPRDIIGALVLDAWIANTRSRQFIFLRAHHPLSFRLLLIDHSHCFGATAWRLNGVALRRPVQHHHAYAQIASCVDLDPWLSTVEAMRAADLDAAAEGLPNEWLARDGRRQLKHLLAELDRRRQRTRETVAALTSSGEPPFTRWYSDLFVASRGMLRKTA